MNDENGRFKKCIDFLDAHFGQLNFQRKMGWNTVDYTGQWHGRSLKVQLPSLVRRLSMQDAEQFDALVVFEAKTAVKTRMTILQDGGFAEGADRALQKNYGHEEVFGLDESYAGYNVFAADGDWAGSFLGETAVTTLLEPHLIKSDGTPTGHGFNFSPEKCHIDLSIAPSTLTKEKLSSLLSLLASLASLAEEKPPYSEVTLSPMERITNLDRPILLLLLVVVVLPLLGSCCCGLIFMATTLMNAQ